MNCIFFKNNYQKIFYDYIKKNFYQTNVKKILGVNIMMINLSLDELKLVAIYIYIYIYKTNVKKI